MKKFDTEAIPGSVNLSSMGRGSDRDGETLLPPSTTKDGAGNLVMVDQSRDIGKATKKPWEG